MKIFWSWQSDTPGKVGRHFVRSALAEAIQVLKEPEDVDEPSEREAREALHLDQDRKGVPGSPDLAPTIFRKIDEAAVFVTDVTLVAEIRAVDGTLLKKLVNSNVAIEYGYALKALTDARVLMVQNTYYGGRGELPFDLRHKAGPLQYRLAPNASKTDIEAESKRFRGALIAALRPYIGGPWAGRQQDRIELSFDRDARKSFWLTPDADGNRSVSRHAAERKWSMSFFCVAPRIFATSDLNIHTADAMVYHPGLCRFVALEDKIETGFAGPGVQRDMTTLQRDYPAFSGCRILANQAEALLIPKAGAFETSLSAEYTFTPALWGSEDTGRYSYIVVILHLNTRFLLLRCLVPDMTASSPRPAFFAGEAELFDTNDRKRFEETARTAVQNLEAIRVAERTTVWIDNANLGGP
jgi:hypothetical protein